MLRITIILGGLVCAALSAGFVRVASATMTDAQKRQAHRPYIAAATDCIARAIAETPVALRHARQAMWLEAVRITGRHCDPLVGRMLFAHDELFGSRTERAAFQNAYVAELPYALAAKLQPVLGGIAKQRSGRAERLASGG